VVMFAEDRGRNGRKPPVPRRSAIVQACRQKYRENENSHWGAQNAALAEILPLEREWHAAADAEPAAQLEVAGSTGAGA